MTGSCCALAGRSRAPERRPPRSPAGSAPPGLVVGSEAEDQAKRLVYGPSSPASRRPADRPRRCGSTTVVCPTSTHVHVRRARSSAGSPPDMRLWTSARPVLCSARGTRRPGQPPRSGRHAVRGRVCDVAAAVGRPCRGHLSRAGMARARRVARGRPASRHDHPRHRPSAAPPRAAPSGLFGGPRPRAALCAPPLNRSSLRRALSRAQRPRHHRDEHGASDASTERGTIMLQTVARSAHESASTHKPL